MEEEIKKENEIKNDDEIENDDENNNSNVKALVQVFTSPTCPHCPPTKKLVESVVNERDDANYEEVMTVTQEGSVLAQKYGIMSVPTIIITGPGSPQPIGLAGMPPKKGLNKAIDISLGKDKFKEDTKTGTNKKNSKKKSVKSFIGRLFKKK